MKIRPDLAQKLVRAKDVNEVVALQSEFAESQKAAMQTQAKELGAVAQDAIGRINKLFLNFRTTSVLPHNALHHHVLSNRRSLSESHYGGTFFST